MASVTLHRKQVDCSVYNEVVHSSLVSPKRLAAFRIDEELLDGLERVWQREGVQPAEQVLRAIRMWLDAKGLKLNAAPRPRVTTRKA